MTSKCVKELVDFINVFHILPRHVSASGCHLLQDDRSSYQEGKCKVTFTQNKLLAALMAHMNNTQHPSLFHIWFLGK
jgi:hypothetical protein